MTKQLVMKRVISYEVLGFGLIVLFLWLDEILDLPHYVFAAPATPINWRESCFESLLTVILAAVVIALTQQFLKHIKYLEGFILFCAGCKRVRVKGSWIPVDVYVRDFSAASVTHGLCPECLDEYCGGWEAPHREMRSPNGSETYDTDAQHCAACRGPFAAEPAIACAASR